MCRAVALLEPDRKVIPLMAKLVFSNLVSLDGYCAGPAENAVLRAKLDDRRVVDLSSKTQNPIQA